MITRQKRKRQAQGIEKAKTLGKYFGRQPDHELRQNIRLLLNEGKSWSQVQISEESPDDFQINH
ncbi:hypothetical protein [Shewanella sp. DC2-4]|uniref:hypothetical protein n=1 Tax=Shewanella sp. DC2-4 TaxID=2739431 RepID=UPI0035CCD7EC